MKVLIINTGEEGQILFSTPLIRALKHQLDDVKLSFLTSARGEDILRANPYIDHLYSDLPSKGNAFDVIIDLDSNFRSFWTTLFRPGRKLRLPRPSAWQKLLLGFKTQMNNVHIVDQYVAVAAPLGVHNDDVGLDYFIPEKDEVPVEWLPANFQKDYVVFSITVPYNTRRLPLERMIELCDKINKPVLLIGDAADSETGNSIANFFEPKDSSETFEAGLKELNKRTIVYNACGKFNRHQQASLIQQARYVVTFDNEVIAVASAFGKEIVTIWGNTVTAFGTYPYNTRFTVLENNRLSCRPCSSKGYAKCPLTHFKCMRDIVFDIYVW